MPDIIIFAAAGTRKQRHRQRLTEHLTKKDAARQFNARLRKAWWRQENPSQALREYQNQIATNAALAEKHRKTENRLRREAQTDSHQFKSGQICLN